VEPVGTSERISPNGHSPGRHGNAGALVDEGGHGTDRSAEPLGEAEPLGRAELQGRSVRSTRPPGPSVRPALVVVGIAAALMIGGTVASGLAGSQSGAPAKHSSITAKGSPLTAEPAKSSLSTITSAGEPPGNVLDALTLPVGTKVNPGTATNAGVGLYDRSLSFVVADSEQKVIEFFRVQLHAQLWTDMTEGPAKNGPGFQIIGQHPGSDGYEWEVGVTVMPETFSPSAGAGAATNGVTPFTMRLFQQSDQD
jgi:hypothetical protein